MEQSGVLSNVVKHEGDIVVGDVLAPLADLGALAQPGVADDAPLDASAALATINRWPVCPRAHPLWSPCFPSDLPGPMLRTRGQNHHSASLACTYPRLS